ncbi:hypothetical protein [Olivibacter sp. XZL3]|uniref:hypothetical protein n=1 Tax=Olivibacter sp. XZL3 TaxID=1735116 RepID=UPI001066D58B|nr:hypothetical protein [Olivibacter sp. XZL3]
MFKFNKLPCYAVIGLVLLCSAATSAQAPNPLDKKVTFKVYAAERLESVFFRLESHMGARLEFNVLDFASLKAKPADYQAAAVKDVLEEQLDGTDFKYELRNGKLILFKKEKAPSKKETR